MSVAASAAAGIRGSEHAALLWRASRHADAIVAMQCRYAGAAFNAKKINPGAILEVQLGGA